jgi:hypothetical protein
MAVIREKQFHARLVFKCNGPLDVYDRKTQVNTALSRANIYGYKLDSFEQVKMMTAYLVIRVVPIGDYTGEDTPEGLVHRAMDSLAASTDIQEAFFWVTGRPDKCSRSMRVLEAKWEVRNEELRTWKLSDEFLDSLDASDSSETIIERVFKLTWDGKQMFKYTNRMVLECEHRDKAMLQGLTGDIVNLIENAGCVRPDFSKLYDVMKPFIKLKR